MILQEWKGKAGVESSQKVHLDGFLTVHTVWFLFQSFHRYVMQLHVQSSILLVHTWTNSENHSRCIVHPWSMKGRKWHKAGSRKLASQRWPAAARLGVPPQCHQAMTSPDGSSLPTYILLQGSGAWHLGNRGAGSWAGAISTDQSPVSLPFRRPSYWLFSYMAKMRCLLCSVHADLLITQ